uniref:DUF753 domain-containing protein n=1 Tax=Glossina pallidipes TaxID=7398 RepID=A0A1A9ZDB5_GLOPL
MYKYSLAMPTIPINFCFIFYIFCAIIPNFPNSKAEDLPTLKCYKCNSEVDGLNCTTNLKHLQPILCEKSYDKCYMKIGMGGDILRGCVAAGAVTTRCQASSCVVCDFEGCNDHNVCKSCSTSDADCSKTDVSDKKFDEICESSQTECLAKVTDGKVERRCAQNTDHCNDTCTICSGALCNDGVFPKDRLSCFQCNGIDCKNPFEPFQAGSPCRNYIEDDKCYTYGDNDSNMQRGCVSDELNPCAGDNQSTGKCLLCNSNGCNSRSYKRPQVLKCIQCEGSKENTECFNLQDPNLAADCSKKELVYTDEDACYTHLKNNFVKRGCLYEHMTNEGECKEENGCEKCSGVDGCNHKEITFKFTCVVCRSDTNTKCQNNAKNLKGTSCRTDAGWSKGCFYGIWNNVIIRGCYVDAHEQMQYVCSDKSNTQCHVCEGNDCNTSVLSNASSLNASTNLYLQHFLSLLIAKFYFI